MSFDLRPGAPAPRRPPLVALAAALLLTACTALAPGGTEFFVNAREVPAPAAPPAERVEVNLRFREAGREVQAVPNNWASIKVTLSHATLLSTSKTATINQNAGSTVPATGVVFSNLRPGSDYSVSVELYDAQDLGGNQLKKGVANPVTLNAGANTVTITLTDPGAISGSVTVAFPSQFTINSVIENLNAPAGVVRDSSGNLYVADASCRIFKRTPAGVVSVLAGSSCATAGSCLRSAETAQWRSANPAPKSPCDGAGTAAKLVNPKNMTIDASGNIYFNDSGSQDCMLRRSTPGGTIETLLGADGCGFSNATSFGGKFRAPEGVARNTTTGDYYIGDTGNHMVRKVTSTGEPSLFAGTQGDAGKSSGSYVDDTGNAAGFNFPKGVAIDPGNTNLYVADSSNHAIRKVVISSQVTTTMSGGSSNTSTGPGFLDGIATVAKFRNPSGLSLAADGNLYVADTGNHSVRKVILSPGTGESVGQVVTIAGNGSSGCNTGSGTSIALFTNPSQVFKGTDGKLYVANTGCNSVNVIE
ncbi:MAG: hypothetical protein FJZ01_27085 [Candidatus Sericytochromatia bacterium]|nr:hypothetical protein [Candidatus Tanganyikabacteria bacterium]